MLELTASLASCALVALTGLLAIPVAVLLVEVLAAVALPRRRLRLCPNGTRPRIAVLIPAHNESVGLLPTIQDVRAQLRPHDRVLVVADNCTDDTAVVAAIAGAEVVERNDQRKVGKGYALDWGIQHLSVDPPGIIIVIDADCRLAEGAIDRLATTAATTGRPTQALYLMTGPDPSPINYQVAELAWRMKNWVRPLGLSALGLPCQLMGTGMAISVGRDPLGRRCKRARRRGPQAWAGPCASGTCASVFSLRDRDQPISAISRRRQEPATTVGTWSDWDDPDWSRAVDFKAVERRNVGLLALAVDMLVPPLTLLGMLTILSFVVAALASLFGLVSSALFISIVSLVAFTVAVVITWVELWSRNPATQGHPVDRSICLWEASPLLSAPVRQSRTAVD